MSNKRQRKPQRRQLKSSYGLDFQSLEPRQMLSVTTGSSWPNLASSSSFTADEIAQEKTVREFLDSTRDTGYLQDANNDLRLIEVKYGLASTTTRFQQTIDGIPVHGAFVTVNQGPDGEFQQVHNQGYAEIETVEQIGAQISMDLAEDFALAETGADSTFAPSRGELVWLPGEDGKSATKAWQVTVYAEYPHGDFLTLVSAVDGKIEFQENRMAFATGSGLAYVPNPYQEFGGTIGGMEDNNDATSPILDAMRVNVTLEGLDDGTGLLVGEFVDLATLNSPTLPDIDADEPTRIYEYDRDDERFEQVVIYHSVDSLNRYFHTLGFDDDAGPTANGIRDFPTLANAHWFNDDNSFYSTGDDAIHFGDGGVDDGEDADIVAHEYGHAVQHDQNAAWGGGEMGAMGEGFGDYLAASFYADAGSAAYQTLHAAAVGEWDATSYSSDDPPNLRRVDGDKMYPDDLNGSVHDDGEIWSAALWDIRAALGGTITDQLVLESHFGLPGGATMPQGAIQILLADQNINGGANETAIRQAFEDRGILEPLPFDGQVDLDKNYYQETDTITVTVEDANGIDPVEVTIESSGGDVETFTLASTGTLGLYDGTINTAPGANAADGILQVALGDTITVTYNDPDDGTGSPSSSQDTATVANIVEYPSTDTPLPINSNTTIDSVVNVADAGLANDVMVLLNITHTWDADLDVFLTSPGGTVVELFTDVGGSGDNFVDTMLSDDAAESITSGSAPFTGTFRPEGILGDFDFESITGDWTLSVTDDAGGDEGTLDGWSLFIDVIPVGLGSVEFDAPAFNVGDTATFTVSDLNASGTLTADVTTDGGDLETVTLTDNGDGTFSGSIATAVGSIASDGVLQVQIHENIYVTYNDADDGSGGSGDRTDMAFVENRIEYPSGDVPGDITDNSTLLSTLEITDAGSIFDLDLSLDITHTFTADLDVTLTSPDGTVIELFSDVGGGGDNFTGTILDDEADTPIGAGSAPFTGRFQPVVSFSTYDGISMTGTWTLAIADDAGGDQGTLNAWSLWIDVEPVIPDVTLDGPAGPFTEGNTGSTNATFQIQLSEPATEIITVDYATTVAGYANPATPGVDFIEVSGTATFNPGDSVFDIDVPVIGEQYTEVNEEFGLELTNASPNSNLVDTIFDVTISDDDGYSPGVVIDFVTPTSDIQTGAVGFLQQDYSPELGMGWSSPTGLAIFELSRGNDLIKDVAVLRNGEFVVDLPDDTYDITMHYGAVRRIDAFTLNFEGGPDIVETLVRGPNVVRTYQVTVADGQLNIGLDGQPDLDRRIRFAGIEINPVASKGGSGGDSKGDDSKGGSFLRWNAPDPQGFFLSAPSGLEPVTTVASVADKALAGSFNVAESNRSSASAVSLETEKVEFDLDRVFEELEF